MKTVAALLLGGMLIIWTEAPTGTRCPWVRHRPAVFAGMLWNGRGEGQSLGSISPVSLSCQQPGANLSLLSQAAPGPAHPSASPVPGPTHPTSATAAVSAPRTTSAASPPVGQDASHAHFSPASPMVESWDPTSLHPPPWVAEGGYGDSGSGQAGGLFDGQTGGLRFLQVPDSTCCFVSLYPV